jgi:hypothetical protein
VQLPIWLPAGNQHFVPRQVNRQGNDSVGLRLLFRRELESFAKWLS